MTFLLFYFFIFVAISRKIKVGLVVTNPNPGSSDGKECACNARDTGSIPESGRSLEKERVSHFKILVQSIPWTEKPGGLQSMESQRVRQD